ncbi:hypothetical protein [Flammeovirga pacifica]|uniref:Uncharacterized protein n=1 Tax=Flammeovirga pacifica TaxID=915059 RepID=A0A1S1Z364_FLAPC|nr:hypothetical protein [Flammeovirga pacifica]OHX67672.1 hypothetical protein NH26_15590 [Flammeovirga pacifica]
MELFFKKKFFLKHHQLLNLIRNKLIHRGYFLTKNYEDYLNDISFLEEEVREVNVGNMYHSGVSGYGDAVGPIGTFIFGFMDGLIAGM